MRTNFDRKHYPFNVYVGVVISFVRKDKRSTQGNLYKGDLVGVDLFL